MWSALNMQNINDLDSLSQGNIWGDIWLPAEVDVSIRPGWFFHAREDHQVKSLAKLVDIYYQSVGHNANLLLNFPIDLNGKIAPTDSIRAMQLHETINRDFAQNLLKDSKVKASNSRSMAYSAENVLDDNYEHFWSSGEGVTTAELEFEFPQKTAINRIMIQEYIALGQKVEAFGIDFFADGKWQSVPTKEMLTTIGYKRILRFPTVEAEKIKIAFKKAKTEICITKVGAYFAETLLAEPEITRDFQNFVSMKADDENAEIRFTTDGSKPDKSSNLYTQPFELNSKATIMAIACDKRSGKSGEIAVKHFDLPTSAFKVAFPSDTLTNLMFDGNPYTSFWLNGKTKHIDIQLNKPTIISGIRYTPSQVRDATSHITNYEIYIDGKMVSKGDFQNIKNNPVEQIVRFKPTKGRTIRFVSTRNTDNSVNAAIAEFSLITE
ncbi:MAG: discoidin domain-containing protein [Bacteroidales bacterium]|nr:discoidin domain-containing protein [Bacteroidales bacterium]